jgi:surfeit locus 1 family protein
VRDAPPGRRWRAGLAIPVLFALAAFVTFIALGTWQLQRKAWKEALIGTLERRLSAPAVELPPRERWGRLDPAEDEFRRVKFSAAFVPGAEALVYASGSAFRSDVSGPGYWVLAPVRLAAGGLVVVNRGFVPEGRQDPATRTAGEITGSAQLVGVMRWPESRGIFSPKDEPARNLWFVRDPVGIASAKSWGDVAPFFVELESPRPPGDLPRVGALKVNLRNEHLQYAITWYGLALVVVVMFGLWFRARGEAVHAARAATREPCL